MKLFIFDTSLIPENNFPEVLKFVRAARQLDHKIVFINDFDFTRQQLEELNNAGAIILPEEEIEKNSKAEVEINRKKKNNQTNEDIKIELIKNLINDKDFRKDIRDKDIHLLIHPIYRSQFSGVFKFESYPTASRIFTFLGDEKQARDYFAKYGAKLHIFTAAQVKKDVKGFELFAEKAIAIGHHVAVIGQDIALPFDDFRNRGVKIYSEKETLTDILQHQDNENYQAIVPFELCEEDKKNSNSVFLRAGADFKALKANLDKPLQIMDEKQMANTTDFIRQFNTDDNSNEKISLNLQILVDAFKQLDPSGEKTTDAQKAGMVFLYVFALVAGSAGVIPNIVFTSSFAALISIAKAWFAYTEGTSGFVNISINFTSIEQLSDLVKPLASIFTKIKTQFKKNNGQEPDNGKVLAVALITLIINIGNAFANWEFANESATKLREEKHWSKGVSTVVLASVLTSLTALVIRSTINYALPHIIPEQIATADILRKALLECAGKSLLRPLSEEDLNKLIKGEIYSNRVNLLANSFMSTIPYVGMGFYSIASGVASYQATAKLPVLNVGAAFSAFLSKYILISRALENTFTKASQIIAGLMGEQFFYDITALSSKEQLIVGAALLPITLPTFLGGAGVVFEKIAKPLFSDPKVAITFSALDGFNGAFFINHGDATSLVERLIMFFKNKYYGQKVFEKVGYEKFIQSKMCQIIKMSPIQFNNRFVKSFYNDPTKKNELRIDPKWPLVVRKTLMMAYETSGAILSEKYIQMLCALATLSEASSLEKDWAFAEFMGNEKALAPLEGIVVESNGHVQPTEPSSSWGSSFGNIFKSLNKDHKASQDGSKVEIIVESNHSDEEEKQPLINNKGKKNEKNVYGTQYRPIPPQTNGGTGGKPGRNESEDHTGKNGAHTTKTPPEEQGTEHTNSDVFNL